MFVLTDGVYCLLNDYVYDKECSFLPMVYIVYKMIMFMTRNVRSYRRCLLSTK